MRTPKLGGKLIFLLPAVFRIDELTSARNPIRRSALGQHQDQPGAEDISSGQRAGLGDTAEFELLAVGENYGIAGHILLDVSRSSNVYSATVH